MYVMHCFYYCFKDIDGQIYANIQVNLISKAYITFSLYHIAEQKIDSDLTLL